MDGGRGPVVEPGVGHVDRASNGGRSTWSGARVVAGPARRVDGARLPATIWSARSSSGAGTASRSMPPRPGRRPARPPPPRDSSRYWVRSARRTGRRRDRSGPGRPRPVPARARRPSRRRARPRRRPPRPCRPAVTAATARTAGSSHQPGEPVHRRARRVHDVGVLGLVADDGAGRAQALQPGVLGGPDELHERQHLVAVGRALAGQRRPLRPGRCRPRRVATSRMSSRRRRPPRAAGAVVPGRVDERERARSGPPRVRRARSARPRRACPGTSSRCGRAAAARDSASASTAPRPGRRGRDRY